MLCYNFIKKKIDVSSFLIFYFCFYVISSTKINSFLLGNCSLNFKHFPLPSFFYKQQWPFTKFQSNKTAKAKEMPLFFVYFRWSSQKSFHFNRLSETNFTQLVFILDLKVITTTTIHLLQILTNLFIIIHFLK